MAAAGYQHFRFVVQSYPSVFVRASENRYPETDRAQRAGIGGCPSYDADADWARDSVVNQIANGLKFVSVQKGVQFLDLRDAFQGREICSQSTSQASVGHPPSPTTSEWVACSTSRPCHRACSRRRSIRTPTASARWGAA